MVNYFDIHTHNLSAADTDCLKIVNVYEQFEETAHLQYCSTGIHPWYTSNHVQALAALKLVAPLLHVMAIGECGLDKACKTNWQLQTELFTAQIELANMLRKPLVIHCVRAHEEVMQLLGSNHTTVPVIFHGFNKKGTLAKRLTDKGYYLSLGAALLSENAPAIEVLRQLPADRFLLETDNSNHSIQEIYSRAAQIRETTEDNIILQVRTNVQSVFNQLH